MFKVRVRRLTVKIALQEQTVKGTSLKYKIKMYGRLNIILKIVYARKRITDQADIVIEF